MVFSPICSAVYAFGLVRLISRCYAVPQCFTHPNRCLLVPGLSIPFGLPFVLACPVLACITLLYWSSLCSCRATVHIPFSYIRIPSSPWYWASFLTNNTSEISCHVRRFIRCAFDNSHVIAGYSLNFPWVVKIWNCVDSTAFTCTERAFVTAGEGSERELTGNRETGEEVGNSVTGVRGWMPARIGEEVGDWARIGEKIGNWATGAWNWAPGVWSWAPATPCKN